MPKEMFVSRAAFKLADFIKINNIIFKEKYILDIGSSTGGFTQLALSLGAKKVLAIEKGTNQMSPLLRNDRNIILREKTDFLKMNNLSTDFDIDIVLIDVSFISSRKILVHLLSLIKPNTLIVLLFKPQFEVQRTDLVSGIVKNEKIRRNAIKDFELWLKHYYLIMAKQDAQIAGLKGNQERVFLLKKVIN